VYFYKSSRLIRAGLVKLTATRWGSAADLTDQIATVDRRVLDCIVGLDGESSEVAEGSNLYVPQCSMEKVVLPDELKDAVTKAMHNFAAFRRFHKQSGLAEAFPGGSGLVVMFSGPSGVGKTLTVNAIAASLNQKVLLVNFPLLMEASSRSRRIGSSDTCEFQSIFREAQLNEAIMSEVRNGLASSIRPVTAES
jgi:hypothetical protein